MYEPTQRIVTLPNGNSILARTIYAVIAAEAIESPGIYNHPPRVIVCYDSRIGETRSNDLAAQSQVIGCETLSDAVALRDKIIADWRGEP